MSIEEPLEGSSFELFEARLTRAELVRRGAVGMGALTMGSSLMALIGCGDDEASEPAGGSGAKGPSVDEAKAIVAAASEDPKFEAPGPPVDASAHRDKTIWLPLSDASIPFFTVILEGFNEAAKELNWKAVTFDGKGQTREQARGLLGAVAAKADGIVVGAFPLEAVPEAARAAKDADIPMVGITTIGDSKFQELDPLLSGEANFSMYNNAEILTAYAIATTPGGVVHGLNAHVTDIRSLEPLVTGFEETFEKLCPTECSFAKYDLLSATFINKMTTATVAALKRNPETNWLFGFDIETIAMVPALRAAGMADKVKIGSFNAVKANLDLVKQGSPLVADVGQPLRWLGWALVDRLLRAMAGQVGETAEEKITVIPNKLFDKASLEGVDTGDDQQLFKTDYQSGFKELWGLS